MFALSLSTSGHVGEAGVVREEGDADHAGWAGAVFGDEDFGGADVG